MKNSKGIVMLAVVIVLGIILSGCSPNAYTSNNTSNADTSAITKQSEIDAVTSASAKTNDGEQAFTSEELAKYDGKNGEPAYVAVNGVVYDVSDVDKWANGEHFEGLTAGKDLTKEIMEDSPHGLSVLDNLPIVGTLSE